MYLEVSSPCHSMALTTDLCHSSFGASINNGHTCHKAKNEEEERKVKNEKTEGMGKRGGGWGV